LNVAWNPIRARAKANTPLKEALTFVAAPPGDEEPGAAAPAAVSLPVDEAPTIFSDEAMGVETLSVG
jgi:hypothetical protein